MKKNTTYYLILNKGPKGKVLNFCAIKAKPGRVEAAMKEFTDKLDELGMWHVVLHPDAAKLLMQQLYGRVPVVMDGKLGASRMRSWLRANDPHRTGPHLA